MPLAVQIFNGAELKTENESVLITKALDANLAGVYENKTVAVLRFNQPVVKFSTYYWLGTQSYIRILEQLKNDDSIAGVVIDVDSGGGQAYGTPEFYDYIASFVEVKPLGIYSGGYLCSGAYYFAAAASFIMVNKRSDAVGSIGTYTVISDFNALWEKMGAKIHTIYASKSKQKNKAVRDVLSGKDEDYSKYIKTELDPFNNSFINDMKASRSMISAECFEGGVWSGSEAVEVGLADSLGTLQDAIDTVYQLSINYKSKSDMSKKTKAFPAIQNLTGISGDGIPVVTNIIGKETGIQIEEAQLEKVEEALVQSEQAVQAAKAAQTTAEGNLAAANQKATAAEASVKTLETSVSEAIKKAGLEPAATTAESISLLADKVVEYGAASGKVTKPFAGGEKPEEKPEDDQEKSTSLFDSFKS